MGDLPAEETRPGDRWDLELRKAFPANLISKLPRIYCGDCKRSQSRVCNRHTKVKCRECKQTMTTEHFHLDYVGHADVTERLLQVDPVWEWRPEHRAVDPELLKAALATGDAEVVRLVIENSPPLIDKNGGMWILLTIHNPDGDPVTRRGYGDSAGKTGTDAMKELVGDALRNSALRFGVALQLWSKADRSEIDAQEQATAVREQNRKTRQERPGSVPEDVVTEKLSEQDGARMVAIQDLANLAYRMATEDLDSTEEDLRTVVYDAAKKNRGFLTAECLSPFNGEKSALSAVINEAKRRIQEPRIKDEEGGNGG
jgi:hypothetical protein